MEIFHSSTILAGSGYEQQLPSVTKKYSVYTAPDFTKKGKQKWILYGATNDYPLFLIDLAKRSGFHSSCLISKTNMLYGGGIGFKGKDGDVIKAKEFFKLIGIDNLLHLAICCDMAYFGGTYPQIVKGLTEKAAGNISKIVRPRFETVRLGEEVEEAKEMIIQQHFYSPDWTKATKTGSKEPTPVDAFTQANWDANKDNLSYAILNRDPLFEYYGKPDYLSESACNSMIADAELSKYDAADVINGMSAGHIITFYRTDFSLSDPDKETEIRTKEEEMVKTGLMGSTNVGKVVIQRALPSDAEHAGIEITPIPSSNTGSRYKEMCSRLQINILSAHGIVAPELAGIPNLANGGFSSEADKLLVANELVFFNRISMLREPIVKFYNKLLELGAIQAEVEILNNLPVRKIISDAMWQYAFTKNEFRSENGFVDLTPEQATEKEKDAAALANKNQNTQPASTAPSTQK